MTLVLGANFHNFTTNQRPLITLKHIHVAWGGRYPDISVKDTLVMDVLVTDISVAGHFGYRTFR